MAAERVSSVLMTADTVGGVWTHAVELAQALARSGVHVHLATMGGPVRDFQRRQANSVGALTLRESEFRLEWMPQPWADVQAAGEWLVQLESQLAPDVVHLNQFAFGTLKFRAPKLVVAHSCVLSWWRAVHGETAPSEWDDYHRVVARGLGGANLVAAPTRAMLSTLVDNYAFRGRLIVIPIARDAALFQRWPNRYIFFAACLLWDDA